MNGNPRRVGTSPDTPAMRPEPREGRPYLSSPSIPGPAARPTVVALALVLVISPQLFGGVFPWAVAATCVMAGVAAVIASRRIELVGGSRDASLLDWMMVVALAWTGLQLLPLPSSLVALLVPESLAAWQSNAPLYDERARSWIPMSLDPGATRLEIAKGTSIVAVFLTARLFAASHQRVRALKAVAASAIALAVVAFAHKAAGATRVFGVYEPVYASTRLLAPLMNENHLGGFMVLTSPILVGLAVDADTIERRIRWALGASICALAGVLSFSRGALLGLAIGMGVFVVVFAWRLGRSHRSILQSRVIPILTLGCLGIAILAIALDGSGLARELSHRHNIAPKFGAAVAAVDLIASHPIAGVGRGAFSAAFVDKLGTEKRYFHPENLPVQWTSEWGIPIALALLVVVVWSIWRGFRLKRSNAHLGGLAGLVGIGTQNLVDFSLEIVGVAVVAAAVLGAVSDSVRVGFDAPLRKLCFAAGLSCFVGAVLGASVHGGDVFTLERRALDALEREDHDEVRDLVRRGLALHHSEPIFALVGAEVAVREGDANAGRWINRAQGLAPLWSAPHLLAARWLFSLGEEDQALIEIREAEALLPGSARTTICDLLRERRDPAIALRAAPEGPAGAKLLDRAAQCLPLQSLVAIEIDEGARRLDPDLVGPATRQARRLFASKRPLEAAALLSSLPTLDVRARTTLAEAYLSAGDLEAAARAIAPELGHREAPSGALRVAASIYLALGDENELRAVAARLRGQTRGKAKALAEVELFLGSLYEADGRHAHALKAYEASNRALESRKAMVAIARVAEAMGNRERALLTYKRLCRADGDEGAACASAEALQKPAQIEP